MTETWLHKNNVSLCHIENFNHEYNIRNNKTKRLDYILRNDIKMSSQFNSVAVEVYKEQLELSRNTVFISSYRPPNIRIQIFNEELEIILDTLEKGVKNVLL